MHIQQRIWRRDLRNILAYCH